VRGTERAGPQDLVHGFDPNNVAAALTAGNWRRKAVLRQDRHGLLYAWVTKGEETDGKKRAVYVVTVKRLDGEGGRGYGRGFYSLEAALRYANGKDGSDFGRYTRPMGRMILNRRGARLFGAQAGADEYGRFLTRVVESILAVDPSMEKNVYRHGITLHPDVEGRKSYGPGSDLPARITVRCYGSRTGVAASFQLFPKDRGPRGMMRAVRMPVSRSVQKKYNGSISARGASVA
jgi:hypothetical protein